MTDRLQIDRDKKYPCERCGALRTKAQGGTVFTVCDACWDVRQAELGKALISLRRLHAERDSLKTHLAKQIDVWDVERKAMESQLAAMTAARDELADWATRYDAHRDRTRDARIAELLAVGKESP